MKEECECVCLKCLVVKKVDVDIGEEIEVMVEDGFVDEEDWKLVFLVVLGKMILDGFEWLVQCFLCEVGFIKVEVCGKFGDGGIDGVGVLCVNLVLFQVYF